MGGPGGAGPWPQVRATRAENARPKSKAEQGCAQHWTGVGCWGGEEGRCEVGSKDRASLSASTAFPGAPKPVTPVTYMHTSAVAAALAHSRYPMNGR